MIPPARPPHGRSLPRLHVLFSSWCFPVCIYDISLYLYLSLSLTLAGEAWPPTVDEPALNHAHNQAPCTQPCTHAHNQAPCLSVFLGSKKYPPDIALPRPPERQAQPPLAQLPPPAAGPATAMSTGFVGFFESRIAWYESVAGMEATDPDTRRDLGESVSKALCHKAALSRNLPLEHATRLMHLLAKCSLPHAQQQKIIQAVNAATKSEGSGPSFAAPRPNVAVAQAACPPPAGQASPSVAVPEASQAGMGFASIPIVGLGGGGGQASPATVPPPGGSGGQAPLATAPPSLSLQGSTELTLVGQSCKFHYNYWRPDQWHRFVGNNPGPGLDELLQILVDVCLMIGCTNPTEPTMASMTGLVWGAARLRGATGPMPAQGAYNALQAFKARLLASRPAHLERASLLKVYPETPCHMSREWQELVYGTRDWAYVRCPFDEGFREQCLLAVPCRSNSKMLKPAWSLGGSQALLAPALGDASLALLAQPCIFGERMQGQALLTRGGHLGLTQPSRAEAIGEAVLQLAGGGTSNITASPELQQLLRQACGSPRRGQATIKVFGSARPSPTKQALALRDRDAPSNGEALPPAEARSAPASGQASPPASSSPGQTPLSAQSASSGQAPPPNPPLSRNLLTLLDQEAEGTAPAPKLKAPAGMGDFLTATAGVIGGSKRGRDEDDGEAAAEPDGETAVGIGPRKRPAAASLKKRPAAMSKGKAPPAPTKAAAKGKASPAPSKAEVRRAPAPAVVRHEDLTYPGIKTKVKVFFGKSTIYTDLPNQLWRWRKQPDPDDRVCPSYSWKKEDPEAAWGRMARDVRAHNRR